MLEPWQTAALTVAAILAVLAVTVTALRNKHRQEVTAAEFQGSVAVDRRAGIGAGILGFLLVVCSGIALIDFIAARTLEREIVALLLWIGSSLFWGIFLLANVISRR
jgi:hypothetical protein